MTYYWNNDKGWFYQPTPRLNVPHDFITERHTLAEYSPATLRRMFEFLTGGLHDADVPDDELVDRVWTLLTSTLEFCTWEELCSPHKQAERYQPKPKEETVMATKKKASKKKGTSTKKKGTSTKKKGTSTKKKGTSTKKKGTSTKKLGSFMSMRVGRIKDPHTKRGQAGEVFDAIYAAKNGIVVADLVAKLPHISAAHVKQCVRDGIAYGLLKKVEG